MATESHSRALVVGGGLAGSLMSILLAQRGYAVDVVDKIESLSELSEERTFTLGLSARALRALEHARVELPPSKAVRVDGACFRMGRKEFWRAYDDGDEMVSIGRNEFTRLLLDAAN